MHNIFEVMHSIFEVMHNILEVVHSIYLSDETPLTFAPVAAKAEVGVVLDEQVKGSYTVI
jgi:hypothetical protein